MAPTPNTHISNSTEAWEAFSALQDLVNTGATEAAMLPDQVLSEILNPREPNQADIRAVDNAIAAENPGIFNQILMTLLEAQGQGGPEYESSTPPPRDKALVRPESSTYTPTPEEKKWLAEGAARVNAREAETGVRAIVDEKGKVTLTNLTPEGIPTAKSQQSPIGFGPQAANVSNTVSGLMASLKGATDPDQARGIASKAKEALAAEHTRIQSETYAIAEKKLGIPQIQARLTASEAYDRQMSGGVVGYPDSKNTAALRTTLDRARANAKQEAARLMASNTGLAQLKVQIAEFGEQAKRITTLSDRQDKIGEQLAIKKALREEKAAEDYESLTADQQKLMLQLRPDLRGVADNRQELIRTFNKHVKEPQFKDVMTAKEQDIPLLAIMGNKYAVDVLADRESISAGISREQTEAQVARVRAIASDPRIFDKIVETMPDIKADKRKAEAQKLALTERSGKKEEKAHLEELRYRTAIDLARAERTNKFNSDVGSWGIMEPELVAAVAKSKQLTGSTDIKSVITAYLDGVPPDQILAKGAMFQRFVDRAADAQSYSVFGGIDKSTARALMQLSFREYGPFQDWVRSKLIPAQTFMQNLGYKAPSAMDIPEIIPTSGLINMLGMRKSINPETGKPFGE